MNYFFASQLFWDQSGQSLHLHHHATRRMQMQMPQAMHWSCLARSWAPPGSFKRNPEDIGWQSTHMWTCFLNQSSRERMWDTLQPDWRAHSSSARPHFHANYSGTLTWKPAWSQIPMPCHPSNHALSWAPNVDHVLLMWVQQMNQKGEVMNGPMLMAKLEVFERALDVPEDERTHGPGWIQSLCIAWTEDS